ncbi:[FeFe] hydrogenase H-cluster maturation GTPase HydF [Clostridium transplantifaecale]|uniref:[FeFe] hydrogenase H-cluster maturation GTPase HydF n=1 Tax=Clostridium transplantifaecale TaxID=2479838 RepID=UPI000F630FA8|nr:[FeFe] hydrogenase H-cluster maturation GTPase HydF [Clostridium transplantifaecale]
MSLNQTPSGERVHIGFFGKRNAGKSSLVNAVTGQDLAIVSDVKGTTTDPVYKSMELLPLGPVMIIDTPGIDDEGELGEKRIGKSRQILNKTDIAVLVVDAAAGKGEQEEELIHIFRKKNIPYLIVYNKTDLTGESVTEDAGAERHEIWVSAATGYHIHEFKERIAGLVTPEGDGRRLVADLIKPSDLIVLVIPVDKAAPKGRLILPQQQVIRDILDTGASAVMCRENELKTVLSSLNMQPKLVITDSQVFAAVDKMVPDHILMTSFSILFARYKGDLRQACQGARALKTVEDSDRILISEGCTHHRQCGDIGTQKLPSWIREYTGREPEFVFTSGTQFPEDLSGYHMVIHCGGCMLNEREMKYRLRMAVDQNVPMTNYGIAIACMTKILDRSIRPFTSLFS